MIKQAGWFWLLFMAAGGTMLGDRLGLLDVPIDSGNPVDRYNVVWMEPSDGSADSFPLGNGDIGLNAWVDGSGDLLFYISKTDAWSEINRLLKVGRVRVSLSPNPFADGGEVEQALLLRDGSCRVLLQNGDHKLALRLWVDANLPVVRVEVEGTSPVLVTAALEVWRDRENTISGDEANSALGVSGPRVESADVVVETGADSVIWYHRNEWSWYARNLERQHLADFPERRDPLLYRTFGGRLAGDGFARNGPAIESKAKSKRHAFEIVVLTAQEQDVENWIAGIEALAEKVAETPADLAWREHVEYWTAFWERSFVRVRTPEEDPVPPYIVRGNTEPFLLGGPTGWDLPYEGGVAMMRMSRGLLSAEELARRAESIDAPVADENLIADWRFRSPEREMRPVAGDSSLVARVKGPVRSTGDKIDGLQLGGETSLSIDSPAAELFEQPFTLEFWVRLTEEDRGGRFLDKTTPARTDELQIDIPGDRVVRFRTTKPHIGRGVLPLGEWGHFAVQYDPDARTKTIVLPEREPRVQTYRDPQPYSRDLLAQQWHLQRFLSAAGGRGAQPIKFNGSIFTFAHPDDGLNADYRRWGGSYWFQNTRLMYWPMLASGDYDLMRPLFGMFVDALPLARYRTEHYYEIEGGAYFPETITFWGTYKDDDYGGPGRERGDVRSPWIRYFYSGNLELLAMMLDFWEHTGDREFLQNELVPLAEGFLRFYYGRTGRDEQGRILFYPSQALETFQEAKNPANEIAGLKWVLPLLIDLPEWAVNEETRAFWRDFLGKLPPLPRQEGTDGRVTLAGAEEIFQPARNSENPELYAVFPFRLFGLNRPELELARETFLQRQNVVAFGWQQSDSQAALLGMGDHAEELLLHRNRLVDYKFPIYWGPNNDWTPDQCHGGNLLHALQLMALQEVDGEILVLPAWPSGWDVHFRLHASNNTTVEVRYVDGRIEELSVTPETEKGRLRLVGSAKRD